MITVIAARSQNNVIGRQGRIPWRIPAEQRWFRDRTMGGAVILGRKSWQEIGRPLDGRQTIVLSRDPGFCCPGCDRAASLQEALALARLPEIYLAGGAAVYQQGMVLADQLCLTQIEAVLEGDTFFPAVDWQQWQLTFRQQHPGHPPWTVEIWQRIPPSYR